MDTGRCVDGTALITHRGILTHPRSMRSDSLRAGPAGHGHAYQLSVLNTYRKPRVYCLERGRGNITQGLAENCAGMALRWV
jgi:hypothetical protein